MTEQPQAKPRDQIADIAIDVAIRISLLFLIIYLCVVIILPFLSILLWGAILAVTLYPAQQWLAARFGGRGGLASTLIVLIGLSISLGPAITLGAASVESLRGIEDGLADGSLVLPPPPEGVADWPIVGKELAAFWGLAATNLKAALVEVKPQADALGKALLQMSAGASLAVLQFAASLIIAGLLFGPGPSLVDGLRTFEARITSAGSSRFVDLTNATVQNVARGVIGVALLQAFLASIGYLATDYPFGAAITIVVLVLSILNLGPTLPVLLSIGYGWTFMDTLPAVIFTIYMLPVGLLDNFLRPIIVARGLPVPIAVMFTGVVGGALAGGLLGLFIGPVILAVGYQLLTAWTADRGTAAAESGEVETEQG